MNALVALSVVGAMWIGAVGSFLMWDLLNGPELICKYRGHKPSETGIVCKRCLALLRDYR